MSDNVIRFRSILKSLKSLYCSEPTGNLLRNLTTLAALISGIIGGKSSQLPAAASKITDSSKLESRVKKFSRLLKNDRVNYNTYFMPYAQLLLACLNQRTLAIIIDGSTVGNHCISLVASIVYKKRALPICWITTKGCKGHLPEELHIKLVEQLQKIIHDDSSVIILGDGEFDGAKLLETIKKNNWHFVCRTMKNRILYENLELFSFCNVDPGREEWFRIPYVSLADYPDLKLHAVLWWQKKYKEPIYLLTTINLAAEATYWYKKRFQIETMFSDKKSRGFNLQKTHISDPKRIDRLLIAAALAYIFIIYFGVYAVKNGFEKIIHRTDRCDLSLCQLGFRMVDHFLNKRHRIPGVQLDLFANI